MRGVWTALITPFQENSEIDFPAFKKILADQVDAGVSGVVVCGTTGEAPSLTLQEKKSLISSALNELKGTSVQVVAGTGTYNTDESLSFSLWAAEQGVSGVMLVTPYYNKPSQAGLEAHFTKIADALPIEVALYNVPGRTGVSLTAETVAKLATHPRIRSLKEATGNVAFTSEILDTLATHHRNLDILSGDDATWLPLLSVGACGVVSVASNLFPRAMVALQNAMDQGRLADAVKLHRRFYPLFRDLFVESNPAPIKAAMAYVGWCNPQVRLPLASLTPVSAEKLNASLNKCEIRRGHKL